MPPLFKRGDELGEGLSLNRWKVVRKVGEGQFAEVYECSDAMKDNKRYAVKVERSLEAKTVRAEAKMLRALQASPHVVRLVEQGTVSERSFMVMELLGMNVADARRSCAPGGRWDQAVMRHIGQHMLNAIAGMHKLGYIHRDIKPANFAITPRHATPAEGGWHVIDFGLARKFTSEDGSVVAARDKKEFRGSTSYASLAAHQLEDLGRRDDLWSWLYVLVELIDGTLPWRTESGDRSAALSLKQECLLDPEQLTSNVPMPGPLIEVSNYLARLKFEDEPDYGFLKGCLDRLAVASPMYDSLTAQNIATGSMVETSALMPAPDAFPTHPQAGAGGYNTAAAAAAFPFSENLGSDVATSIPSFTSAPLYMTAQELPAMQVLDFSQGFGGIYEGLTGEIADTPRSPPEESAEVEAPLSKSITVQPAVLRPLTLPAPVTLAPPAGLAPLLQTDSAKSRSNYAWGSTRAGAYNTTTVASGDGGRSRSEVSRKREGESPAFTESSRQRPRIEEDRRGRNAKYGGSSSAREKESSARPAMHGSKQQHDSRDRSKDRSRERSAGRAGERADPERRDRMPARSRLYELERDRERYREPGRYRDAESDRATASDRNSDREGVIGGGPQDASTYQQRDRPTAAVKMRTSLRADEPLEPSLSKMTLDQLVNVVAAGDLSDAGREGRHALRGLQSFREGAGLIAYYIQRLVGQVSFDETVKVAELLDELRAFISEQGKRCWELTDRPIRTDNQRRSPR